MDRDDALRLLIEIQSKDSDDWEQIERAAPSLDEVFPKDYEDIPEPEPIEERGLTEQELVEFKRLLALYLGMRCVTCASIEFEDRHIVTCASCGKVMGDFKTIVQVPYKVVELL